MMRIALLLPNGYEETEAIATVDLLRRAELAVDLLSITDTCETQGDHGIKLTADGLLAEADPKDYQMVITPGGIPGTRMLASTPAVLAFIQAVHAQGGYVASICASPLVLKAAGLSKGQVGTCYPSLQDQMDYATYLDQAVVQHDRLITAQGPALSFHFALHLVACLKGSEARAQLETALLWPRLRNAMEA